MSEYDLGWSREVLKYVCGISFLIVATYVLMTVFSYGFNEIIAGAFLISGVVSGWLIVVVDIVRMHRGNEDDQ